jgi:hypothetical protein
MVFDMSAVSLLTAFGDDLLSVDFRLLFFVLEQQHGFNSLITDERDTRTSNYPYT